MMFATAFDLVVADVQTDRPKGIAQAYNDIRAALAGHGFNWIQGSLYVSQTEDLAPLFSAILSVRGLSWLPHPVRDIRAFRVEQWSDFTARVKA